MFTIYNQGEVVAQCVSGPRAHSSHIGDWAADLMDLVVSWGYAIEFQGDVHYSPEKADDWHALPLAHAEFIE